MNPNEVESVTNTLGDQSNIEEINKKRFNEILLKARSFDLRPIVRRFMNKRSVSLDRALAVADEMLRYLSLCAVEPDNEWTMTGEVDEMWHTFIIFTKRYREFCETVCGRFIDHFPAEENYILPDDQSSSLEQLMNEIDQQVNNLNIPGALRERIESKMWPASKKLGISATCKTINDQNTNNIGQSYAKTLHKYEHYLGEAPHPNFWPSPSIFSKPQAPQACGSCGGGAPHNACGCGPIKKK